MTIDAEKPVVLVTGGSGYVGSYVVEQLLQEGYRVKTTVRPGRTETIAKIWPHAIGNQLEVVEVADLVSGDFTSAFHGVEVLLHIASPIFGKSATSAEIIDGALNGTTNVIDYAIKAGVKKIIVTGSFVALFDLGIQAAFDTKFVTEEAWGSVAQGEIDLDVIIPVLAYGASKILAERKVWELADANPDIDFTTILPVGVFGGLLPTYPLSKDASILNMSRNVYALITGGSNGPNTYPDSPVAHAVHVKDVARAHILAINAPPLSGARRKRCVINSGLFTWPEAAAYIRERYPELAARLPRDDLPHPVQTKAPLSTAIAEEALGLKDYRPWKEMVDDALETALRFEQYAAS